MATAVDGHRVAQIRRQRGMSQRELAAAVRRSESWVSQVERGVLPIERLSVVQALADALGVPAQEFRAEQEREASSSEAAERVRINELDALRLALTGHPVLGYLFGAKRDVKFGDLLSRVDDAWELVHAARHAELSVMLPPLLLDLETAVRTVGEASFRTDLYQNLSRAYQAASAAFARQDEADASWLAADRAIQAAESAGTPLWVLAAHFRMAHAFIRLERFEQADRVTTEAIRVLEPIVIAGRADPETLSLYGALNLVTAVLQAREGNRQLTREHLAAAAKAAEQMGGDRNDFGTEFGPTNVLLHRVSIAADLGDAGEALEIAAKVDPTGLSYERQARFWLDVARCHTQRRRVGDAIEALIKAERASPEFVHDHHLSRDTITVMLRFAGDHGPDELRRLAERAGVDV